MPNESGMEYGGHYDSESKSAPVERIVMPCRHDARFREVMFAKNGCIACECERLKILAVKASTLIMSIDNRNDLHAVFTIKDSAEFLALKEAVTEVFKA